MGASNDSGVPYGKNVIVHFTEGKETSRIIGEFFRETDTYFIVKGQVGQQIGKLLHLPKSRIIYIEREA